MAIIYNEVQYLFEYSHSHLSLCFQTYPDSGIQLDLVLTRSSIEGDVVTIDSRFILNGVCVIWHGAISRVNLEGTGILQLDAEKASEEEERMRDEQRRAGQRLHGLLRQFLPAVPPDP